MDQPQADQPKTPQTPNPATPDPITETVAPQSSRNLINPSSITHFGERQNLIKPAAISTAAPKHGFWQSITLDVFVVLFAGLFGYCYARYLGGDFSFWFAFGAFLLWASVSVLEAFLQKDWSRRAWIILLETVALILPFSTYDWTALLAGGILMLLCLFWAYFSARRELLNTLEIRFFTASGKVVSKVMTGVIIFMIIMYASLVNGQGSLFISQKGFDKFFSWSAGFVNDFYPTIPLTGSFGDFAQALAKMQLQSNPAFQNLSPADQQATLTQSTNQLMASFSPDAGAASSTTSRNASGTAGTVAEASTTVTSAQAAEPTSNALYNYLVSVVGRLQNRFGDTFLAAWGLILFLSLRSIGIVIVWLGQFVALMFYELLLATGFMKITEETSTREKIGY